MYILEKQTENFESYCKTVNRYNNVLSRQERKVNDTSSGKENQNTHTHTKNLNKK